MFIRSEELRLEQEGSQERGRGGGKRGVDWARVGGKGGGSAHHVGLVGQELPGVGMKALICEHLLDGCFFLLPLCCFFEGMFFFGFR